MAALEQGAQADPARVTGQARERYPRVGRTGSRVAFTHTEVVVRAEERVETELLGATCDGEELVVARALLRFSEDP